MTDDKLDDLFDDGSRVEAAEAGVHHEQAEADAGAQPREHVMASPPVPPLAHHHPEDPNAGVVRARVGRHTVLAATLAAAATVAGVVLLALAVGSR